MKIMNALSGFMEAAEPEAFGAGRQRGLERKQTNAFNQAGQSLQNNDYEGASAALLGAGELQTGLQVRGMGEQRQQAQQQQLDADQQKKMRAGLAFTQNAASIPAEQRMNWMAQNWQLSGAEESFEQHLQTYGPDSFSDQGLQEEVAQFRAALGEAPPQAEQFTLGPGQQRFDERGNSIASVEPKPQGEMTDYQRRQIALQERKFAHQQQNPSNGISIGPDGTVQIGGPAGAQPFGKAGQGTNARELASAREAAGTADATLQLANQARGIIEGGYNSGALAGIRGEFGRLAGDLGLGDGSPDYEQFKAVNNQLAAQMLKLFGGSDTEKELAISVMSNVGPNFGEETNRRMLDQLDAMINAQRRKPEFLAQWVARHGSLDAIDPETGLGSQGSWDRAISSLSPTFGGATNVTQQAQVEAGAGGTLSPEEQAELEQLRARYGGGN